MVEWAQLGGCNLEKPLYVGLEEGVPSPDSETRPAGEAPFTGIDAVGEGLGRATQQLGIVLEEGTGIGHVSENVSIYCLGPFPPREAEASSESPCLRPGMASICVGEGQF